MSLSTPKLVLLVFCVLVAVSGCAVALAAVLQHDERRTTVIAHHVDTIVIHADNGNVRLLAGRTERVVVRQRLKWLWRRPTVSVVRRGGLLEVHDACPKSDVIQRCSADLALEVPFDADVQIDGNAGDIAADGLAGHLDLHTNSGDIEGRRLHPVVATAGTDAGDITLAFSTLPVTVTAASSAGDVEVDVPAGGEFRVDTATNAGHIDIEGIVRNDHALRSISATTDAGSVLVRGRG
jgi:Putative adhesin